MLSCGAEEAQWGGRHSEAGTARQPRSDSSKAAVVIATEQATATGFPQAGGRHPPSPMACGREAPAGWLTRHEGKEAVEALPFGCSHTEPAARAKGEEARHQPTPACRCTAKAQERSLTVLAGAAEDQPPAKSSTAPSCQHLL